MRKRNLLITAYDLRIGGIEKALIAMLSHIDYIKYDVTLVLEKKEGVLLDEVPKQVKINEYAVSEHPILAIRKLINGFNLIKRIIKNYKQYDFSCSYAPYCFSGSIIARYASKNNYIWIHSDYYYLFDENVKKFIIFFDSRRIQKFNNIVFVSEEARENFIKIYPNLKEKTNTCGNLIDVESIKKQAQEKISEDKPSRTVFLNVARHEEKSKKLTRLIEASKKLLDEGYDFEVWMIGSGENSKEYEILINKFGLQSHIKMLGFKDNPYPYYKKADAFILTSDYEGFPVVYLEALLFNLPIITTVDVTIDNIKIENNYGVIAQKNIEDIYTKMKQHLKTGYEIKNAFPIHVYNVSIYNKMVKMFKRK